MIRFMKLESKSMDGEDTAGAPFASVGFAAQRCVANLISGGLIFITQPFKVGDLVATSTTTDPSSGGAFEGVVQRVGWHSTVLESVADGSVLIVPNSDVSTVPVRNLSRREKRVVCETVQLYDMNYSNNNNNRNGNRIRNRNNNMSRNNTNANTITNTNTKAFSGAWGDADWWRKIIFALNRVLRTHPGVLHGSPRAGATSAQMSKMSSSSKSNSSSSTNGNNSNADGKTSTKKQMKKKGNGVTSAAPGGAAADKFSAAATPRCVLVSQPDTGTLMARCTYLIDPSVPEVCVERSLGGGEGRRDCTCSRRSSSTS